MRKLQVQGFLRKETPVFAGTVLEVAHRLVSGVEIIHEVALGAREGKTRKLMET